MSMPFGALDPNGCGAMVAPGEDYAVLIDSMALVQSNRRREQSGEEERHQMIVHATVTAGRFRGVKLKKKFSVAFAYNPFKREWPAFAAFLSACTGIAVRDSARLRALTTTDIVGKAMIWFVASEEGVLKVTAFKRALQQRQPAQAERPNPPPATSRPPQAARPASQAKPAPDVVAQDDHRGEAVTRTSVDPFGVLPLGDRRRVIAFARDVARVDVQAEPGLSALRLAIFKATGKYVLTHDTVDAVIEEIRTGKLGHQEAATA